jgi:hypothetical protein
VFEGKLCWSLRKLADVDETASVAQLVITTGG